MGVKCWWRRLWAWPGTAHATHETQFVSSTAAATGVAAALSWQQQVVCLSWRSCYQIRHSSSSSSERQLNAIEGRGSEVGLDMSLACHTV
jgi:hypothetical protein